MAQPCVWVTMEPLPGRETDAHAFLEDVAARLAVEEPGTLFYNAVDLGDGRLGVFSSFADEAALAAHANGVGAWIEAQRPGLFAAPYAVARGAVFAEKT